MAIEVICPSCDQVHKVKDDAAGKKLRCKGCQEVIPIPAAAAVEEADPWDTGEMEEPAPRQAPRQAPRKSKAKAAKPERVRARSSDGMPIPIIGSIVICGLVIAYMAVSFLGELVAWEGARSTGRLVGYVIRILVNISIIKGLVAKQSRLHWNAMLLDGICLVVGIPGLALIMFASSDPAVQQRLGGNASLVIGVMAIQCLFWVADLVMLLTPSAREYCSE
jgi:hypothetical protein